MAPRKSSPIRNSAPHRALLRWYDENARALPWRIGPKDRARGLRPDPFHVLLSEIMLQQTTVAAVAPRFPAFVKRWPDAAALAATPVEELLSHWSGLGYYARARNLHKCAQAIVERHGGAVPDTEAALRTLPGVGPYTAAAISAIAFDRRAIVVDGNVLRVVARLFAIETPLPSGKAEIAKRAGAIWPKRRSGDFAQALMDLGATVCTPKNPECGDCPLAARCAALLAGAPGQYPKRTPKAARPTRRGAVVALFNRGGEVLLERRPDNGLLGGMLGLPGTPWRLQEPALDGLTKDARAAGRIVHMFTHFRLELDVYQGSAPARRRLHPHEEWAAPETVRLPTVMRKALDAALTARGR